MSGGIETYPTCLYPASRYFHHSCLFVLTENVKELQKVRLHHCAYLEDAAIERLVLLKDSLRHLEISSCGDVTDDGLLSLGQLK